MVRDQKTSEEGLLIAASFFGASMAVVAFDCTKAGRQSYRSWRRCHKVNAYILMLWSEISACFVASICNFLFLLSRIQPSTSSLTATQIQCLMQILANRLSLILYNPDKERLLKAGLFIAIGIINVGEFCIWIPARLQISETFIRINNVWDRAQKVILAIIDLSLNWYFMWLVKSKLVANGLTQYNLVYKCNLAMVTVSISLDLLLIGLMSLPDDAVYIQTHTLAYLTKLNIEMNMADLLAKVVKKSTERRSSFPTTDLGAGGGNFQYQARGRSPRCADDHGQPGVDIQQPGPVGGGRDAGDAGDRDSVDETQGRPPSHADEHKQSCVYLESSRSTH
ncbi:hypothetical protein C8A01DRAFT_21290 [Parachaetomium inaequale]|uniref:Uncharacterized protein n=1 Tax=Parachaetomium inaequale TaxID=2588326 RepID=A0AAN6P675_9PEZI|nr:hypothetical protein C8A01DRAFT_21290 [Parachaetomium inaequale]